jgi:hypothetical protein
MQHFLKPTSGTAGTEVIPTQLLRQFFPSMYDAVAALNIGFGRETLAALAAWLVETSCYAW